MAEGESQGNYTELSPDILMFNILPRLPAKCVGRFRCVSREWHSFLTTTHFANMHLHHVTNDDHQNHQKLLLLSTTTPYNFYTIDCETPNKDGLSASRPLPFVEVGSCQAIHMWTAASLHGLVCIMKILYSDDYARQIDLILWNPLTNDYKTLSRPTSHDDYLNISYYQGEFGLYYTSFDDDYKLLHVTNHTNPTMVYIYSLKSDSWRKVIHTIKRRTTSECIYLDSLVPSILLNEKLYFLKQKHTIYGEHPSYIILMFDTKTEKLREIATPTLRQEERTECMYFIVQRGFIHLCVAFTDSQDKYYHTMELWRMNEDGDGDWTKVITYSPIEPLSWHEEPLHMMRNGDWLMYDYFQGHVLQRDMNKHTYNIICTFKKMEISQRWKYMETLVSPNQYACL